MKTNEKILQKHLNKKIPITRKLGLKVLKYEENQMTISAPLSKNKNDKNTAFAGSLFSVAVLSGWGFLTLKFIEAEIKATVVVYESNVVFEKPVTENFFAVCTIESSELWEKSKDRVIRKKNAKIKLEINIFNENEKETSCVKIQANYFVWRM